MANFPPTPSNPISASAFLKATFGKSPLERDRIAADIVIAGNFPSFLRRLVPITIGSENDSITIKVSPDFIHLGTDTDHMIWSFSAPQAQRIADAFNCVLPTVELSEAIYKNAEIKLTAKTPSMVGANIGGKNYSSAAFVASTHMSSAQGMNAHNKIIRQQLKEIGYRPGQLVAGHKKDIINSSELPEGRLGIHGLYDSSGKAYQKGAISNHPADTHIEYAVGLRLIDRNSSKGDLAQLLKNGKLSSLIGSAKSGYKYSDKPKEQNMSSSSGDLRPMSNYPLIGGIPKGYISFKANEPVPASVTQVAIQIRDKFINMPFGTVIPFKTEDGIFMAEIMPHSNKPRGVTVFKKNETFNGQPKSNSSLDKIYQYYQEANEQMKGIIG